MYAVKEKWVGKIDFDLGTDIGTRTLSKSMPQEHLERIYASRNGSEYVEKLAEKKNEEEVNNG